MNSPVDFQWAASRFPPGASELATQHLRLAQHAQRDRPSG